MNGVDFVFLLKPTFVCQAFRHFDARRKGKVSEADLSDGLRRLGLELPTSQERSLFSAMGKECPTLCRYNKAWKLIYSTEMVGTICRLKLGFIYLFNDVVSRSFAVNFAFFLKCKL